MSRLGICYANYCIASQTVAPTLPFFQGTKHCAEYLASHPHRPIFYPSNYHVESNFIRLTRGCNQVKDYTTKN